MAIEVTTFRLGPLRTNTYLCWEDASRQAVLIDPALPSPAILRVIEKERLTVRSIVATHGHFDHLIGVPFFARDLSATILMHDADRGYLTSESQQRAARFGLTLELFEPNESIIDDSRVLIGETVGTVIHVPGHTPGSICLSFSDDHILFSGDTLFFHTVGRTDLPGGNSGSLEASIRRLYELPDETVVYPGHARQTTIGREKRRNRFLRA